MDLVVEFFKRSLFMDLVVEFLKIFMNLLVNLRKIGQNNI